ncbi:MAG: SRPBCC domain-containing protein, partial [bacterium]
MAMIEHETDAALTVKRTFSAPCDRVYKAWTEPELLSKWFHVGDDWSTPVCEVDLRVGGRYRFGMQSPDSDALYAVHGVFRQVEHNKKLVFTWQWQGEETSETLVTVLFHDRGTATEVELIHQRFPNAEERDKHQQGWQGCLQQL